MHKFINRLAQNFSVKIVPIILLSFSLFSLIILLYIFRYNFPSADDYWYSGYTGTIHNRTQGVANIFKGAFEGSMECYKSANGRVAANFLYALFLAPKSLTSYKLIPALVYILFCFSFIYLILISKINLVLRQKLCIAVTLLALLFVSANYIHNTIYWMGGVTNYFFSLTLFVISFSVFIKKTRKFPYFPLVIASFPMIIVSLSNETLTFTGLWFYFVLLVCSIYYKDRYRIIVTAVYIIILFLGLLTVYFAPSTSIRAAASAHASGDLFWSIGHALALSFDKTAQWLCSPLIPLALLTTVTARGLQLPRLKFIKAIGAKGERIHGVLFFVFAFSIIWAGHFVSTFGRGGGGLPDRAKFMPRFFFIILTFIALLYIFKSFDMGTKLLNFKRAAAVLLFFFITILLSRHFAPSVMYAGQFNKYYLQLEERYDALLSSEEDFLIFPPSPFQPPLLAETYFYTSCEGGGKYMASYFGKKCVILEGKPDGYGNYPTLNSILKLQ